MVGHRPSDWHVLDLDKDPTPGDPQRVRTLAKTLHDFADDVSEALRLVKGMAGESTLAEWAGKSATVFKDEFSGVPKNLKKLEKSYGMCGDALADFWPKLERAQALADRALVKAREARQDLTSAQSKLSSADSWVTRASKEADKYKDDPTGSKSDADKPDEAKVRAATRDVQHAKTAQTNAQSAVDSAQGALDAAKKMAADARKMRDDAAREAKNKIDEASDAGIQNRSWWEDIGDWFSDNWDNIVAVCKVVVAIVGIIAMVIGGPILGAIVLVAALVVLADTLYKYSKGQASLWDVGLAALDCIPGFKGLTTLGGLAKGLKGGVAAMRGGLKGMALAVRGLGKSARGMLDNALAGGADAFGRLKARIRGCGDPVDMATGRTYLSQTDLSLPGTLPLVFNRRMESGYRLGWWFGPSWSSTLDQHLETDEQGVVFVSEDGRLLSYPHPVDSDTPVLPVVGPRWPLRRLNGGGYRLLDPVAGVERRFGSPSGGVAPIVCITDRHGNTVTFDYTPDGTPTHLRHSAGYHVRIATEDHRVTALHVVGAADDGSDVEVRRYGYANGILTSVANSSGQPMLMDYDARMRLTSWTDTNGSTYRYAYDDRDRCVAQSGDAGHMAARFEYEGTDPAWPGRCITTVTNSEGAVTRFVVDDRYLIEAEIDACGGVTRSEFDRDQRLIAVTDALGHRTHFRRDADGRLVEVTHADGRATRYTLTQSGQVAAVTVSDGTTMFQTHDGNGHLVAVTDPLGATTRYTYDDRGAISAVTDALGTTTTLRNNRAGQPLEITDPLGRRMSREYDAFGRIVTVTDALGNVTRCTWTPEGKISRVLTADGGEQSWEYDGEGNCVRHVDAEGGVTRYEYTHFDLLSARTDPDGARYEFFYSPSLKLTRVRNPQGLTWDYAYDAAGRLTGETDFDEREVVYTRDAVGRLVARTNPLGETVGYTLDEVGRTVAKNVAGEITSYTYDRSGLLLRAVNSHSEISWHRDAAGRVLAETVNGRTLHTRYDARGRRTRRVTPGGAMADYQYDEVGRITELVTSGHSIAFTHDAAGHELTRVVGGSLTLSHNWDPVGRLAQQTVSVSGTTVQQRAYSYRPDGHLAAIDDSGSGRTDLSLDPTGRVTDVRAHGWAESYAYDAAGNQTNAVWPAGHGGDAAQGPRAVQGTRLQGAGSVRYEYDGAGRVITRRRRRLSHKPDVWKYTWDTEDRLTSVTTPDGTQWRYRYDPFGRRLSKTRLALDGVTEVETTYFVWDGNVLAEQTTVAADVPHQVTLTWDHDGLRPLSQTERITDATTQHDVDARFFAMVTDLIGAPTELVDEAGAVAWKSRRTLWGVTAWAKNSTAHTPLRFPGQYHDAETGLHYNHYRYYDPETARYTSQDPLGISLAFNPAAYVDNPWTWADPLGLGPCNGVRAHNGRVHYLPLDGEGRATGVNAVISRDMLDTGTSANPSIHPSGWSGNGTYYNEGRGHLLADRLGGSGDLEENLVTLTQDPTNTPIMRDEIEKLVYEAVDKGETVTYEVRAHYPGPGDVAPHQLSFRARGDRGFQLDRVLDNPAGMFGFGETEML
ncbi:RHS repeat-associated core domain-containing protein [Streptomyces sp. enrichment culture]|uniref:RHS repeat-associated core domain-containing protein n=1 Tax=Streptomyces sp. enrichment culture TaxID=1795815 RepID=UPI003F578188